MLMGSLGIAGIPLFSGFWSKLVIVVAAVEAGQHAVAAIAIGASIVTLGAFASMIRRTFFGPAGEASGRAQEAPAWMCLSLVVLAAICLTAGLMLIPQVREAVLDPAAHALGRGAAAESGERGQQIHHGSDFITSSVGRHLARPPHDAWHAHATLHGGVTPTAQWLVAALWWIATWRAIIGRPHH